ncbi:galactokinase [Thalassotalea profundi]|uniref:Galactokinase n=1 Tax=Thalassotalea profundi TaxID=2036687 RepID=A0ABQ3IR93_9GAMM|nr:galactokinase [Thalassotalea profundi]GHE88940.1 galactokinase [Thalassotalea profundi]
MDQNKLVITLFEQEFNETPAIVCHAPGRVNIIGDHTDYNDGFVLPAAINYGTTIAAKRRDDHLIKVYAHDCEQQSAVFSLDEFVFNEDKMWCNYVIGSVQALMKHFPAIRGANLAVTGNVPQGAGLSSSASFEVAILKAFTELYELDLNGILAAKLGQAAENDFVGCNCGIMDQLISAMGQEKHAMLLDCRQLTFEDAPIPDSLSLFIVNSNVKRGLVDSEYNHRREQCEAVARHFNKDALRDVSIEMLTTAKHDLPEILYKRARHVITENQRTIEALSALKSNDIELLSKLMKASHASLRDDFEVSTKEIDGLVEIIDTELGLNGGVRMTGGGFGGCVIALVPNDMVDKLTQVVNEKYPQQYSLQPNIYICHATQGAFR